MRQNEPPGMPRGTKTLAWFMDRTGIFEKQQQMMQVRRNSSSDDSKSTTPSAQQQFQQHQQIQQHQQQQKKQKRYRKTLSQQGTTRKEAFGESQAMSESSEEGTAIISTALTSSGAPSCATPGISAPAANNSNNEEYWFYDVATDGYYYEQNGAKGWRRRQPNQAVHKSAGKDSEVAHMNVNGPSKYNQLLAAQAAAAAQAAFLQQAFQLQAQQASQAPQGGAQAPPPPPQQQPTMRYYDANSDGFFYEMASVDGWKRRQPNKPVSASVPAGITRPYSQRPAAQQIPQEVAPHHQSTAAPTSGGSSYGAALARGQFPRNTVKHDEKCAQNAQPRGDSTTSSQCGDTFAELFSSSDPVYIPRPSALNLEQKAVSPSENSTAALFDAVLADFGGFKATSANLNPLLPGISSQSPMKGESWNSFRSCSLFSPIKPSKRAPLSSNGQTQASAAAMEDFDDDSTMKMLIQDLDKLWANSPVSGLNQA